MIWVKFTERWASGLGEVDFVPYHGNEKGFDAWIQGVIEVKTARICSEHFRGRHCMGDC